MTLITQVTTKMPPVFRPRVYDLIYIVALGTLLEASPIQAASTITPDGSLGTNVTLDGSSYDIGVGTLVGTNQFHSFMQFDVGNGDTANFTGPPSVTNILSRVTGPTSIIDGTIKSSIDGANLWIINPNGMVFGATSSIDITGSLHVSTADSLLDGNGGAFYADPATDPGNALLFTGDPTTFGFLNAPSGNIILNGANLSVGSGQTISMIGNEVSLDASSLTAPGGRLNLTSVGSAGTVTLLSSGIDNSGISYNSNEQVSMANNSTLDTDGPGGGSIFIRGGSFVMVSDPIGFDEDTISANTTGSQDGGVIDIQASNNVQINGLIAADTSDAGKGGNIHINAASVNVANINTSQVQTTTTNSGNAGSLTINADDISLGSVNIDVSSTGTASGNSGAVTLTGTNLTGDSVSISSRSLGSGIGGNITIDMSGDVMLSGDLNAIGANNAGKAGDIQITGRTIKNQPDGLTISTDTNGSGNAGNITLNATDSIFFDGAYVSSTTRGTGAGGSVSFSAPSITLEKNIDLNSPYIIANAESSGNAGVINIAGQDLTLRGDAFVGVSPAAFGATGSAGNINIDLSGKLDVGYGSSIISVSTGAGSDAGGNIAIQNAAVVNIDGLVSTSSINSGGNAGTITFSNIADTTISGTGQVTSTTDGTSNAGNILFNSLSNLTLDGVITTSTTAGGMAGRITFSNNASMTISGSGKISSETSSTGNAGDIQFNGPGSLTLDGVAVSTASSANGNGGSISVNGNDFALTNNASISANSTGTGDAGSIDIYAADAISMNNSSITSSASLYDGGDILMRAQNLMYLVDSTIRTDAAVNAGNIQLGIAALDPIPLFLVMQRSVIDANAGGNGGAINIYAQHVLGGENTITATSSSGNNGTIIFDVPADDLVSLVTVLDIPFLNVANILNERCAANAIRDRSSFVVESAPLPPAPNNYAPSSILLPPISDEHGQSPQLNPSGHIPGPIELSMPWVGCL